MALSAAERAARELELAEAARSRAVATEEKARERVEKARAAHHDALVALEAAENASAVEHEVVAHLRSHPLLRDAE